jgi:hypothetical protein
MGSTVLVYKVRKVVHTARLDLSEKAMAKLLSHLGPSRTTWTTCQWSKAMRRYVSRIFVNATLVQS